MIIKPGFKTTPKEKSLLQILKKHKKITHDFLGEQYLDSTALTLLGEA